jgi:4-amino-4-deoxy-L-arabinose transferase-like glycosyltransferase
MVSEVQDQLLARRPGVARPGPLRALSLLFQVALALFAIYAIYTIPSLLPRWGASPVGVLLLAGWLIVAALAWPIARDALSARWAWAAIVGAAIGLRLGALALLAGRSPGGGDPQVYLQFAHDLLAGRGLQFHDQTMGATYFALFPPVYPLLLALIGAPFGLGPGVVLASNLAVDLGSAVLITRIGARIGDAGAGRAAAWLFVTWPTFVLGAPLAQKEPLITLLVLAMIVLLLGLRSRQASWRDGAAFGALTGLLALTQPLAAPFPVVLAAAFLPFLGWRRLWSLALRAAPAAILVMAPWWIRNAVLLHAFVPLTSAGGLGIWIGNNPAASGNWMQPPARYIGLPELQMSARAAAEGKAWIMAHPVDFVRLTLTKTFRTMGVEQFTMVRFSMLKPAPGAALQAALLPLCQGSWAVLLAAAALLSRPALRRPGGAIALLLAIACLADFALFTVLFEFGERHRYVLTPFLCLVATCGLAAIRLPAPGRGLTPAASPSP